MREKNLTKKEEKIIKTIIFLLMLTTTIKPALSDVTITGNNTKGIKLISEANTVNVMTIINMSGLTVNDNNIKFYDYNYSTAVFDENHTFLLAPNYSTTTEAVWDYTAYLKEYNLSGSITLNVIGINGLISQPYVKVTGEMRGVKEYWTNPISLTFSDLFNETNRSGNFSINVTDMENAYKNYDAIIYLNDTMSEYNITLEPNKLNITFSQATNFSLHWNRSNNAEITGYANVLEISQTSVTNRADIYFNYIGGSYENYTQYYEYENNNTGISENLKVIPTNNIKILWVQTINQYNEPLRDVKIRFYQNDCFGCEYGLIGQRITDGTGLTWIYADEHRPVFYYAQKEGYGVVSDTIELEDLGNNIGESGSNPYGIIIIDNGIEVVRGRFDTIPREYYNNSEGYKINISVVAPGYRYVQFKTDKMSNKIRMNGPNGLDEFEYELREGTHFNGGDDIHIELYAENDFWKNVTIKYIPPVDMIGFDISNVDPGFLKVAVGIMIILMSTFIGVLFKNPHAGATSFMIMSLLASFITRAFLPVFAAIGAYYLGKFIIKIIREEA